VSAPKTPARAAVGDLITVTAHHVGESERVGEILEVLGEPGHEHFRVRWDDGHESVFYPSSDATNRPAGRRHSRT
jgi:hypothetical protein